MSKLKELTLEVHKRAERSEFASKLIRGLTAEEYYKYIYNQYMIYDVLEAQVCNLIPEIKDICIATRILEDLKELEVKFGVPHADIGAMMPVVREYEKHVYTLDRDGILAHVYVRHFGDMYGGQIIKKRNPGSGTMYDFDNVEELKTRIRAMLSDDMAEEANRCFEFAIQLFKELQNE
jgi:heme oxygenase